MQFGKAAELSAAASVACGERCAIQTSPQPFDKHNVQPDTVAIHGELAALLENCQGEPFGPELAALVGVDNPRRAETGKRFFNGQHTARRLVTLRTL